MEEEGEEQPPLSDPAWVPLAAGQNCHSSGRVSLSLAEDCDDGVCTRTGVYPA